MVQGEKIKIVLMGILKAVLIVIHCIVMFFVALIVFLMILHNIHLYDVITEIPNHLQEYKITEIQSDQIDGSLELYTDKYIKRNFLFLRTEDEDKLIGEFHSVDNCSVQVNGENRIQVTTRYYGANDNIDEKIYILNLDNNDTRGVILLYRVLSFVSDDFKVKL